MSVENSTNSCIHKKIYDEDEVKVCIKSVI